MRDIAVNLGLFTSIAPAVLAATATGATVDLLGCNAAAVIISTGAIAGSGKFAPKLQESDDGGTWTDVAAGDILGGLPAELAAGTTYKASYRGFKRYIRPVLTLVSGTSIAATVIIAKSALSQRPAA